MARAANKPPRPQPTQPTQPAQPQTTAPIGPPPSTALISPPPPPPAGCSGSQVAAALALLSASPRRGRGQQQQPTHPQAPDEGPLHFSGRELSGELSGGQSTLRRATANSQQGQQTSAGPLAASSSLTEVAVVVAPYGSAASADSPRDSGAGSSRAAIADGRLMMQEAAAETAPETRHSAVLATQPVLVARHGHGHGHGPSTMAAALQSPRVSLSERVVSSSERGGELRPGQLRAFQWEASDTVWPVWVCSVAYAAYRASSLCEQAY